MPPIRKLIAGVGSLSDMDPVIPAAAALAQNAGLPLEIIHAFDLSDPFVEAYLRDSALPGDPLRRYAEGLQARLEGQVGGLGLAGKVACRAAAGRPDEVLEAATADGDALLVLGPTHRSRPGSAFLGTTAQRVLHRARTPVLVLKRGLAGPLRVLYAADPAWEGSARMMERGAELAASLTPAPFAAQRAIAVIGLELDAPIPGLHDRLAPAAEERLSAAIGSSGLSGVERSVRSGRPAGEIVAEATEWPADLIVMGTHGRTGAARALLGSVAQAVMRDAPCSVLIIRGE